MAPKVLDQKSLLEREQQIIDAAIHVISEQGIENLTMDKVVANVPFSKGTVYKHFIGKEDLLVSMNNQAASILSGFFLRAKESSGNTRGKMMLLNFSYLLYAILHPVLFKAMLCSNTTNISAKSSQKCLAAREENKVKLLNSVYAIINEAIDKQELQLPNDMDVQQVCFANWSMNYGVVSLLSDEVDECTGRTGLIVEQELINQCNLLSDGLQWKPLRKDEDGTPSLKEALQTIFSKELALIKTKGRELSF